MKTFGLTDKLAIREKIWHATGADPGAVHPDHFLSATRGGMSAGPSSHPAEKCGILEVHFLPSPSGPSNGRLKFSLN